MSRNPPDADRLTVASLHAIAQRHVHEHSPRNVAIYELQRAATQARKHQRPLLRTDLLARTAGVHYGSHRADPLVHWDSDQAAQLLIDAAADETYRNLAGGRRLSS